jgi:alkanesulfonate monooxygenase SsuD/methylene tetrahydromethanopterin reductase-like flavin-dependent oxidoreductase (luciferase family)
VEVYLGDAAEIERLVTLRARQTGRRAEAVGEGYAGTPAEVAERIREVTRAGIDYIVLRVPNAAEGGAIQRVAQELLPLLA